MTRLAVAGLLLWCTPLAAQGIPVPGDRGGARARADSLYLEAIGHVEAARAAVARGDDVALNAAVRAYRRVMPYALVWQGRACWLEDYRRRLRGRSGVAYPMQAVMGETLVAAGQARRMSAAAEEVWRGAAAASLEAHARTLLAVMAEMRGCR